MGIGLRPTTMYGVWRLGDSDEFASPIKRKRGRDRKEGERFCIKKPTKKGFHVGDEKREKLDLTLKGQNSLFAKTAMEAEKIDVAKSLPFIYLFIYLVRRNKTKQKATQK